MPGDVYLACHLLFWSFSLSTCKMRKWKRESSSKASKNQADNAESQQMNLVGDGGNGALGKHIAFKSTFENKYNR